MAEVVLDRRRLLRRYALYGTAALVVGGVAYKAYTSDAVWQTRRSLVRLRAALQKYSEALSSGADLCCTLVRDLQSFLQSDSSELPPSLQQLAKLLQSPEVMQTTTNTVAAVYRGVAGDQAASSSGPGEGALDKVLAALLSDRGHSLVSVAVSMGARNLVGAWVEASSRLPAQQLHQGVPAAGSSLQPGMADKLLDFLTTERGQQLAVTAITAFVTNGMRVYMDATLDINFYEDMFSSMARPQHLEAVKQCIGMFAREAVGTAMQGSPPRQTTPRSRATLIRELSPPSSPRSPGAAGSLHFGQEAEQCGDGRGSPLDSAYRSPSPGAGSLMGDEATSTSMGQMRQRRQQEQHHQGSGEASGHWAGPAAAAAADDLDSDSLLYSRRDMGAKGVAPEQPAAAGPAWLPMVTKEVLTMAKDQNARTLVMGAVGAAAGASAREICAAAVVSLGQLEVVRRWGTRGLVALLLLTFLTACLIQELLRAAVLAAVH